MDLVDPETIGFWESMYDQGAPPWDQGEAAPPLIRAIDALSPPAESRVFVPGCGFGHEALFLAGRGYSVTALDFAEGAVTGLRRRAANAGLQIEAVQADLLELPREWDNTFDLLVEHTCFCAIPLHRRADYIRIAARVLRPDASLLGLFFEVDGSVEDGPPFPTTRADVVRYFEPAFEIHHIERPQDSFAGRRGREWLAHMRRI